jgi:D-arginine dehydrogenase
MMADKCQILIIGSGITAVSLGARLARWDRTVWLLEREEYSGCQTTERAVAPWDPAWVADPDSAALGWASAGIWDEAPDVLTRKDMLHIYSEDWLADMPERYARGFAAGTGVEQLEGSDIIKRFPYLKSETARWVGALFVPAGAAGTIDVRQLYSHFRAQLYRWSGQIFLKEELLHATFGGGAWTVRTNKREIRADVIINCAGPWADEVARRCDTRRIGLWSTKRVALNLAIKPNAVVPWPGGPFLVWQRRLAPFICDLLPRGRVIVSPATEEVSPPCDPQVEAWEVAAAIGTIEDWTTLRVLEDSGPSEAWLRTCVRDRRPVIGWARDVPAFYWVAGLGWTGIESTLAISAIASDMVLNRSDFAELVSRYGIRTERFSPDRVAYAGVSA